MSGKVKFPLKLKAVIIIIALSAVLCAVSIVMSAIRFSKTNEENFKDHSKDIAYMASLTVDGDALRAVRDKFFEEFKKVPDDQIILSDDWGSDEFNAQLDRFAFITDMPEYKKVLAQLSKTQTLGISSLSSIYAMDYDLDRPLSCAVYLVDAAEEDPCLPGVVDHAEEADWSSAAEHKGMEPYITNYDAYGWLVSATAPVFDSNGEYAGVVCVDLDMNDIKANESAFILRLAVILVSLTVVICVITLLIIDFAIIRPLNKLSRVATGYIVENENKATFASVNINRADEIGNLSDAMKKMERDIDTYINDLTHVTAEKERISTELSVAARIQADMLPTEFTKNSIFDIYAAMTPAKEIGGDFYDFFMMDDDHLVLVMADVSGKGVPAALFMVIARTLLKIRTTAAGSPSDMLRDVGNTLCDDNPTGLFVTAWLGILSLSTGELVYANAGHEYPAVIHKGGDFRLLTSDNMPPLATDMDIPYATDMMILKREDELFLYTDGVPDAKNASGERFGTDRMVEMLNRYKDKSTEELIKSMKQEVDSFRGSVDPFDDITMLGFKYLGK